ncbi:hypothetical protein THAOC_12821 [Thalassiosira oceanica]|uniref:Uncharacterized protein n=1 Tax=Thalassiosira oceanica TaxID=159749 RepID=K0SLT5_THAOC|nr:hypothetical protein THAOC_12821 [Thalassiosira oceanica]|eukprot:EJK66270.1 hypothetical protein THAOC_12821 [Thalassiosira oceanica]
MMLSNWLDKKGKKSQSSDPGYVANDADCIICVWSTDSFQSFPRVLAFHSEAMKFIDQIDCDGEDCYREQITDNTNRIEIRFWTKKISDFVAIMQTVKEIFSGRKHQGKNEVGIGGESKSTVALSAKYAFEAYLELNHFGENITDSENNAKGIVPETAFGFTGNDNDISNDGNDKHNDRRNDKHRKMEGTVLDESEPKPKPCLGPCMEKRKSPWPLLAVHSTHGVMSPRRAECDLDFDLQRERECKLDSTPPLAGQRGHCPLTNYSVKVCTATDGSIIGQQTDIHELLSLLNRQCPVACWMIPLGEEVPGCVGTLKELGDCDRVLGHIAKRCLDVVGEVYVRHAGDRGFTKVSRQDLKIYRVHPGVPMEITIPAFDDVDVNGDTSAGCNVNPSEIGESSMGGRKSSGDCDSAESPTIVGSKLGSKLGSNSFVCQTSPSPSRTGPSPSHSLRPSLSPSSKSHKAKMCCDEIGPPQNNLQTGAGKEAGPDRGRPDKESSQDSSDLRVPAKSLPNHGNVWGGGVHAMVGAQVIGTQVLLRTPDLTGTSGPTLTQVGASGPPVSDAGLCDTKAESESEQMEIGPNTHAHEEVGTSGLPDTGGLCDAGLCDTRLSDAAGLSDASDAQAESDSEQMQIVLDTHGLSGTTKSLLVGRMMDEFHDRPSWTLHLDNSNDVVGMKFRTNDLALFDDELEHIRRVKKKHSLLYAHCTVSNKQLQRRQLDEKLRASIDDKELDDYARGYMSDDELSQWRYYSIKTDAFGTALDVNYPVMHSLPFSGGKSEDELRSHMSRVYKSHLTWLRRMKKISHRRVSVLSRMYASDRYLSTEMENLFHAAMGRPILRMIMENLGVEEDEFECEELRAEKELSSETMERLYELFIHKINKFPIRESTGLWPVDTLMRCQDFLEEEYIGQREESNGLPKARTKIVLGGTKEPRSSISSAEDESESQHRCDSQTTEEVYSSSLGSYMDPAEKLELERKYRSYCAHTYDDSSCREDDDYNSDSCSISGDFSRSNDSSCGRKDDDTVSNQLLVSSQMSLHDNDGTACGNIGDINEHKSESSDEESEEESESSNKSESSESSSSSSGLSDLSVQLAHTKYQYYSGEGRAGK